MQWNVEERYMKAMPIAFICLTEEYKRDLVSMKDQDSPWIINGLNRYYI